MQRNLVLVRRICSALVLTYLDAAFEPPCPRKDFSDTMAPNVLCGACCTCCGRWICSAPAAAPWLKKAYFDLKSH